MVAGIFNDEPRPDQLVCLTETLTPAQKALLLPEAVAARLATKRREVCRFGELGRVWQVGDLPEGLLS
jgi:hypothetical protein